MNARLPAGVLARADFPMLRLIHIHRLQPAFDRLPLEDAFARRCALFRHEGRFIAVREDPLALDVQQWVESRAGKGVEWYLVTPQDLSDWLNKQAEGSATLGPLLKQAVVATPAAAATQSSATVLRLAPEPATDPVDRLIHEHVQNALKIGASAIHFESTGRGLVIRQRIDGVLETSCEAGGRDMAPLAIAGLKRLAKLEGAGARAPCEGRIVVRVSGRAVALSLSVLPGFHGEDAVVRVTEKRRLVPVGEALGIERLGFTSQDRAQIRHLAKQPYGLFLATGPVGCGTTTTLYGVLADLEDGRDKLVTVEDPIEFGLPGILQIDAGPGAHLSMAEALRAALQHDPDCLMIGAIRDAETAELAVQAALSGRRVLAAMQVNHALDAIVRFEQLGISPDLLAQALNGVMSQRLLRTVCPHCAEPIVPTTRELSALGLPPEAAIGGFRRGVGCGECRTTGYRGRRAVAEILVFDDRLRTLIGRGAPLAEIKAEARRQGMQGLRDAGLQLARAGLTTLEEVARVTRED